MCNTSETLMQYARLTHALDTCIEALGKILEKHGTDWVQVQVIFGREEFKIAMEALKEACDAMGYVLELKQPGSGEADASTEA